ncbi:hypothetical protein [Microbacterium sp. SLBN-154]|uniref:hypothetical protein n=1 Tax=Microbacterium sp. SLBN-154 TaxID=2768458 RepID=UPI0013577586|nr:hypothetical protein [Microbacterium sp. SLBN-154]
MGDLDDTPDWIIDLSQPRREPQADPRLPLVAEVVRGAQAQLSAIGAVMGSVEEVIRECAAQGMTRDEIAEQCGLSAVTVDRVLAGGTLFVFPKS